MDFGDILDEWDKIKEVRSAAEGEDKDSRLPRLDASDRGDESRRIAALRPQAVLDLHGMTADEAESAIDRFMESSARGGLEKVLLIHGKGLHSEGGLSVLKGTARKALEAHRLAGRFGEAAKADGGSGALWVMIRKRRSEG
jgi:DNA-nicking Smr family endonuclease